MPGEGGSEPGRFVVDESSFDFRGLTEERLTDLLDEFTDELTDLVRTYRVTVSPWWSEAECAPGTELHDVLYEGGTPRAGRDARLRMVRTMDRCPKWDTETAGLPDEVELAEEGPVLALSVGFAWLHATRGHHIGCLVFPTAGRVGWQSVVVGGTATSPGIGKDVFFLTGASSLTDFWRDLFSRENVAEQSFVERAREAFPDLVFADSLTFRRFDGTYGEMRDWVVRVLSVVHDHFIDALAKHAGIPADVKAELGHHGLNLSPESPNTRAKAKIMKQREVVHGGEKYLCEWHAKKDRHRNRVHFSLPEQRLDGRVLIGIFVDHLDT
ncbi:hypothetical protein ACH4TH_04325 [Streptomyces californicus]|uniref:hypothetical protein n=1 Tax=Streptomyces californicus TaxID=67351 RepID=UPI0037B5C772